MRKPIRTSSLRAASLRSTFNPNHTSFRVGALIPKDDSDRLYSAQVAPLYESLSELMGNVNAASVFIDKRPLYNELDTVDSLIRSLDDRLAELDAAEVNNWKANALVVQNRLQALHREFAVYTAAGNSAALISVAVASAVGGVSGYTVYRRKKAKKWAVFAGSLSAAVGGFATWFFVKPKFV